MIGLTTHRSVRRPLWQWMETSRKRWWLQKNNLFDLVPIGVQMPEMVRDKERRVAAGMDDYIAKPIREKELSDLLKRYSSVASTEKVS